MTVLNPDLQETIFNEKGPLRPLFIEEESRGEVLRLLKGTSRVKQLPLHFRVPESFRREAPFLKAVSQGGDVEKSFGFYATPLLPDQLIFLVSEGEGSFDHLDRYYQSPVHQAFKDARLVTSGHSHPKGTKFGKDYQRWLQQSGPDQLSVEDLLRTIFPFHYVTEAPPSSILIGKKLIVLTCNTNSTPKPKELAHTFRGQDPRWHWVEFHNQILEMMDKCDAEFKDIKGLARTLLRQITFAEEMKLGLYICVLGDLSSKETGKNFVRINPWQEDIDLAIQLLQEK